MSMERQLGPDTERTRTQHFEKNLRKAPEALHPFYRAIFRDLPVGLTISHDGLIDTFGGTVVSSPFRVKCQIRNRAQEGWSWVIELRNPENLIVECILPGKLVDGRPREAVAKMADKGFLLHRPHDFLIRLIKTWPISRFQLSIDTVGWTSDRAAFALPTGNVITGAENDQEFAFSGKITAEQKGGKDEWDDLAKLCSGNPNLLFACSVAFGGSLLPLSASAGTTIFHLFGRTSVGKTRVLRAGCAIWPRSEETKGKSDRSWASTSNGLEAQVTLANHMMLGLDELPKDPPPEFGDDLYKVANNAGKQRATKDGTAAARQTWETLIVSTGEVSMQAVLKNLKKPARGGQSVRMLDIPVMGDYGAFDEIHGHESSDAFVADLDQRLLRTAGYAGATFVSCLLAETDVVRQLDDRLNESIASIQAELGIKAGDTATTEIRRVIQSFALVAVAGEWATEFGITGWQKGAAETAVVKIAERWLGARGGDAPHDQMEAIVQTRDYLLQHETSHFVSIHADGKDANSQAAIADVAGYRDSEFVYVFSKTFSEIHTDRDATTCATFLRDAGYLVPGGQRSGFQYRLSKKQGKGKRPWVYRINRAILEA